MLYLDQFFYCVLFPARYLLENSTAKLAAPTCYYLLLFRTNLKVRYLDQIIFLLCAISCPQVCGKSQSEISSKYMLIFLATYKLFRRKCKVIYLDHLYLFVCAILYLLLLETSTAKLAASTCYYFVLFRINLKVIYLDQITLLLCAISCALFVGKWHSKISSTYMLIFLAI